MIINQLRETCNRGWASFHTGFREPNANSTCDVQRSFMHTSFQAGWNMSSYMIRNAAWMALHGGNINFQTLATMRKEDDLTSRSNNTMLDSLTV